MPPVPVMLPALLAKLSVCPTGLSLTPVMVIFTVSVSVRPVESVTV